jgi:hypothetical protein
LNSRPAKLKNTIFKHGSINLLSSGNIRIKELKIKRIKERKIERKKEGPQTNGT